MKTRKSGFAPVIAGVELIKSAAIALAIVAACFGSVSCTEIVTMLLSVAVFAVTRLVRFSAELFSCNLSMTRWSVARWVATSA